MSCRYHRAMRTRAVQLRLPVLAQDVLLAVVVAAFQVQGTVAASERSEVAARPLTDFAPLGYALLIAGGLVLVARRRWPVMVFVTAALANIVYYTIGFSDGPVWIGLFIAIYTLTCYGDGRRTLVIAGAGTTVLATVWLIEAADIEPTAAIGWVFFRIVASIMAAALGESVRSRRVIAADATARAELAERTREDEARARVDAERLRIAREVHDTVAHAIAIINVQSGVTAYQLDKRPERARETLETIEQTSAQALHEMRAILGVLRDTDNDHVPHPGLGQIDDLLAMAGDAGLRIDLTTTSPSVALPSAVDSTAYRVVQESITNVIRHVGPTRVTITLDYQPDALELRFADDGAQGGSAEIAGTGTTVPTQNGITSAAATGNGIAGMRERCELLGGDLTAGPLLTGGFEVKARLPFTPTEAVNA